LGPPTLGIAQPARANQGERDAGNALDRKLREPWSLRTAATLRPGQKGTKQLVDEFGERMVARCRNHLI